MLSQLPLLVALAAAALAPGQTPPTVILKGDDGGKVDGTPWSSDTVKGKVYAFFYIDPDEKGANEDMEAALKAEKFPLDKFGSIAVINMAATWLPNAAIAGTLKSKQEEFPDVIYAKDLKKALVTAWGLKDDAYDVLVFDKAGKLLFSRDGTLSKADLKTMIETIKTAMAAP